MIQILLEIACPYKEIVLVTELVQKFKSYTHGVFALVPIIHLSGLLPVSLPLAKT
jgi:hypothetical protein